MYQEPDEYLIQQTFTKPVGVEIKNLHFSYNGVAVKVHGVKRMLIYEPVDRPFVYPYPEKHLLRRRGQVDPTDPDYVRFPNYESISGKLAILNPGDILVFPMHAPHYTDTLETSVSMVLRWH